MPKSFSPDYDILKLLEEKLNSSGLEKHDAKALGIKPYDGTYIKNLNLPWKFALPFFTIPYTDPWGGDWGFVRARLLVPQPTPETPKYTQSRGSLPHAYFPTITKKSWQAILTDPSTTLYITEGELKAIAATKRGYPTIGLGGVWNFKSRKYDIPFLPELDRINWKDREVIIIYDSDLKEKLDVRRAKQTLANELITRGAVVKTIDIDAPPGRKVGLDDLLLKITNTQFDELLASAYEMEFGWRLLYDARDGVPYMTVYNAEIALSASPEFEGVFYWDGFRLTEMVSRPLLGYDEELDYPRPLNDTDYGVALSWLQRFSGGGLIKATITTVHTAITNIAKKEKHHPIKDYLDDLTWDGKKRLQFWLYHTFGVEKSEYTEAVARFFFISMVARAYDPGCQIDYMLVIEGDQGLRKSTACRVIAGGEEFFATIGHERDATRVSQLLRGKWLIEFDELSAIKKSDIEEIKGFVTRRTEKYIPKYGRKESQEARSCIFIGTTNEFEYLRDIDNRRFWPVAATKDDIEWLEANRDQLFAEAVSLYEAGERYYPEREFEKLYFKPEQDRRRVLDDYVIEVSSFAELRAIEWAETHGGLDKVEKFQIIPRDIANSPRFLEERMNAVYQRVNNALRLLGWRVVSRTNNIPRYSPFGPAINRIKDRAAAMAEEKNDKVVPLKRPTKKY